MSQPPPSRIGIKSVSGEISDEKLHAEIMDGVDDSALRLASAKRAVEKLGFTREQAESLFNVRLAEH